MCISGGALKRTVDYSKGLGELLRSCRQYIVKAKKRMREINIRPCENLDSRVCMRGLALAQIIALAPSTQRSGFQGLTRQRERHRSSSNGSLVKPHEVSTRQALMQYQSQEPKHCSNGSSALFITVQRGRGLKVDQNGLLRVISTADWRITTLAPPTPDLHDDSRPVGR